MKNTATQIRQATVLHFEGSKEVEHEPKSRVFSPNQNYYFEATTYSKPIDDGVTLGNYFTTKIEIYDNQKQEKLFDFLRNDAYSYHYWLEIDGNEYLFLSEFQNGMSIYNLTEKAFQSYINLKDEYQITQYYPSPDCLKIAVVAYCYPNYLINVYDISKPMNLPYPLVYKKVIEDTNANRIESLEWRNSMDVDIIYQQQIRIGKYLLKVEIFEVFDEYFWLKCRFKDIHGKEYICTEKVQATIGSVDENTKFPFAGQIDVELIKKYTLNNQKICTIALDLGWAISNTQTLDVLESEVETYWYHKDYIK